MEGWSKGVRAAGESIAFVPTMGALHEGHAALIAKAKGLAGRAVVSLFVNPTQFNDPGDLERYPRDLEGDLKICEKEGADVVFAPDLGEIYPKGALAKSKAPPIAGRWEGESRPGHFDGVVTVVKRLFEIVGPQIAIFGEKDYQQLLVIREMTRSLDLPIEIIGHATVRTTEGVAASSRNRLLTGAGYQMACAIPKALGFVQQLFRRGERSVVTLTLYLVQELQKRTRLEIDYAAIVDAVTLEPLETVDRPARILIAVRVEGIRLIDNAALDPVVSS